MRARLLDLRTRSAEPLRDAPPLESFCPSVYGERSVAFDQLEAARGGRAPIGLTDDRDGLSVRLDRPRLGPPLQSGDEQLWPLFFSSSELSIPAFDQGSAKLKVRDWNLANEAPGYLALTSLDSRGRPQPRRGLTLVAAMLPLTMMPATALAAPGGGLPVLHQPAQTAADEQPEPAPANVESTTTTPEPSDSVTIAPSSTGEPAPSMSGLWSALVGANVRLGLQDGSTFEGKLLGVHGTSLICARREDGLVVAVDQAQVVQANTVEDGRKGRRIVLPRERGNGLLVTGAVLTAIAGGLLITGLAGGLYCANDGGYYYSYYGGGGGGPDNCNRYWVPFVVPGAALAGAGIPMIVIGDKRRKAWKKRAGVATLSPQVGKTRGGWSGGLSLRF